MIQVGDDIMIDRGSLSTLIVGLFGPTLSWNPVTVVAINRREKRVRVKAIDGSLWWFDTDQITGIQQSLDLTPSAP